MARSGFGFGFEVKKQFFRVDKLGRSAEVGKKKALSKIGAFVRVSAQQSIRTRKAPSKPGQPPSSHTKILKRFIYFFYDPFRDSVIVGPAKTNQTFFDRDRSPVRGTVPEVLERGGEITLLEVKRGGRWQRADLRSRRRVGRFPQRYRTVRILPRPYMQPALERERDNGKLEQAWKDVIQ